MSENGDLIIGIDLGTSNSAACVYKDGKTTIIPSAEGASQYGKAFPSYVAFMDGEILVGEPARRQAVTNPENTISSIKRKMGTDFKVEIQGKEYTPQEISAMILQKIKKDAETFLGEPVEKAVITVPAYFDDNQRTATKDAGEIAGLEVVRLVNEPTAASLAYGIDKQDDGDTINILVFDLGGGTLDVTIMEFGGGVFKVKSTSGDTNLGGNDMDDVVMDFLATEFKKETGIDLKNNVDAQRRLREASEQAKIELSNTIETTVNLPFIAMDDDKPHNLINTINRSKLESLVNKIVEKCGKPIDQALNDAKMTADDIDKIILVGGPTRMPIVQDYVEKHIGKNVERGIDPMECVAQGAAIQSGVLTGDIKDIVLLDVTPLSLGTVVVGGITSVIIERNTRIPISRTETYTTVSDNQSAVNCEVVQGEHRMASNNKQLGEFVLDGIPPARRGIPKIDVTFELDANGILNVTAKEQSAGREKSITIRSVNKMSDSEIERAKAEAEQNAENDAKLAKLRELINEADAVLYTAKNFLSDSNLSIEDEIRNNIEELISELENAIVEENPTAITIQMKKLNDAVADAGSSLY